MIFRWRVLVVGSAASLGLGFLFGVLVQHPAYTPRVPRPVIGWLRSPGRTS